MTNPKKTLRRLPKQGQIAGVCAGIAEYFELDVTLVRVIFVVLAIATGGAVVVGYIALAIILPVPQQDVPVKNAKAGAQSNDNYISENVQILGQELQDDGRMSRLRNYMGVGLLVLGTWLLLVQFFPQWLSFRWEYVWPVLLIIAGFLIITRRR